MKWIVACECSGVVRDALIEAGHDAISADLKPTEKPGPHLIIENDQHLKDVLYSGQWDGMIGHPPCTRLNNAGWWYVKKNQLWQEVKQAADFFNMVLNAPIPRKAVENPIQSPEARKYIRIYNQIIQPYNFNEDASKQTCLWLVGLPKLKGTGYYPPRIVNGKKRWGNQTDGGWNKLGPSENRSTDRSRTYPRIAKAMAEQWGKNINL